MLHFLWALMTNRRYNFDTCALRSDLIALNHSSATASYAADDVVLWGPRKKRTSFHPTVAQQDRVPGGFEESRQTVELFHIDVSVCVWIRLIISKLG